MATDNITPVLRGASAAIGAFVGDADRMTSSLARIGAAAAPILAIGAALYYAGQQASQVQQNVANLNSVLHGTSEQLAAIRQNGLALSQATQFTDAQILQAQRQLAKGGATPADLSQFGSEGVTGATLNLAASTQVDPTRAATAMTTASKAFGLGNDEAAKTATALAQAVDTSVGTLESQATALRQVGVVARAAGMDMRDTVTTIAALQNQGLGTTTGTSLTTFMLRLEAPTVAAKQAIADLNLQFYNLNGTLKSTPEIFDEIRAKTVGLTDEAANADLEKIFGLRGIRVADIAKEQGGGFLVQQAQQMNEMGSASDIAARKLDTFQGSASKALSSLNVLAVQMGQTVVPVMKGAADDILGVANALTSINSVVPQIPQIVVAAGALGVAGKIGGSINDRQAETARTAAEAARKENEARIAANAEFSNAMAAASFQADSKIIAADEALAKQQEALNNRVYEQYLANEEKMVAATEEADAKRIASINEVTARTLASLDEINVAFAASTAKQIDMQALTFAKERAMLVERQQSKVAVGEIKAAGMDPQMQQQAIFAEEQASLARQQAIRAEYLQKDLGIQARAQSAKIDATISQNAQQVAAIDAATQAQVKAIIAGGDRLAAAQAEAGAKELAALNARAAEEKAAIERVYLSQVGTSGAGGAPMAGVVEGSIMAGAAGRGGTPIPVNTKVVAGATAVDEAGFIAGATKAFSGGLNKIVSGIGQLILPVTVALLAKEFVINPVQQAIIDHVAGNDPQLNQIKVQTKMVIDNPSNNQQEARAAIDQQANIVKEEIQKKQAELEQAQGKWWNHVPVLSGVGRAAGGGGLDEESLKKEIADLQQAQSDLAKKGGAIDLIPKEAMTRASDEISTIMQRLKDGTITQAQAEAQWKSWGASVDETSNQLRSHDEYLKSLGLTTEQIISINKQFIDSEDQVAKAVKAAAEDAFATYRENAQQAQQALNMGVPEDVATGAFFKARPDQSSISKAQQELDVKIVKQYTDAWKQASDAINGVDISKGINGLADMRRKLDDASNGLNALGIGNPALQGIAHIADSFGKITDAEKQAQQAMDGYNLTLSKTNEYMGKLGQVQKDFDQAVLAARYAQAAGRSTAEQDELLAKEPIIRKTLLGQQQQLSANMAIDVLGEVKNLPDFKALDDYMRDIVKQEGGGLKVVATITTNLDAIKTQLDTVLADRTLNVTINPVLSQFDPTIQDTAKQWSQYYQNMGGNSPYDERSGSPPPGGGTPPVTPPPGGWSYTQIAPQDPGYTRQSSLGYQPLSPSDYMAIVKQSEAGKSNGVFEDPAIRDALLAAAQKANVDPRAMLAFTKYENNDAINISPEMNQANNFGGIKFANQPGARRGPISSEGDPYAAFNTPEDFFMALARNLSTGTYAADYQKGDITAIRRQYVVGGAGPATNSQEQNIANTVDDYNRWRKQYPGTQGVGTGGNVSYDPSDQFGGTAPGSAPAGTGSVDQTAMNLRQRIVQTAMQNIDVNKLVGYCEQFVEETVQQATGKRGATGTPEGSAASGLAHAQSMGLVTKTPQPGDLVYYGASPGNPAGHVAIYVGTDASGQQMQVSTWDRTPFPGDTGPNHSAPGNPPGAAIHLETVGQGAQFVNTVGGGGYTYGVGDPGNRGNATGGTLLAQNPFYLTNNQRYFPNVNATDPNNPYANPIPERIYPTNALPALGSYGQTMRSLDPRGQGEMQQFFDRMTPVFASLAADQKGYGPTGEFGKYGIKPDAAKQQEIDNLALQENLTLTVNVGKAIENINNGLAVTPKMYDAIRASAGPLGDLVVAQVQATAQLEEHTNRLSDLKKQQQDADLAYQQQQQQWQRDNELDQREQTRKQWARQVIDEATQDSRTVIQRQEQDADTSRQRNKTLQDRDIEDTRRQQQWGWQDEEKAITNRTRLMQEGQRLQDVADTTHKEAIDDAFQTESRAFQDRQRTLEFRGGQESIALQDARKQLDEQHRLTVENAQQTGGLYTSLGKGSQTEAGAMAFASQAAAIDDARKKADDLYRKQSDANTREQDALSKTHAQEMFNLETEMLLSQRGHEDEIKEIDRTAERRHNNFSVAMFDIESEGIARQQAHEMIQRQQQIEDTMRSRSYEDESFDIQQTRLLEQRRWQDADEALKKQREAEDQAYTERKWQQQDIQQGITDAYQTAKKQNSDLQQDEEKSITDLNKQISGIDLVISKYDTLLKMFGDAANQALGGGGGGTGGGGTGGGQAPIRQLGGYASGTPFSPQGYARVNEEGGEIRFLSTGESILPADQTQRLISAVLGYNGANNQQGGGAQTINGGNVTINLNDEELRVSAATADKIRALVRQELEDNATESPTDSWASRGGMRR